ncbi:sensor histidine kinase [Thermomonas carbonis]|uniref:histidine kinase n=1 Tax=Thermomonas carbonis TaxID=1463158 RepID=A0A7G9SRF5_9GAMM|nr:HAMP domain-containing sensor histidine kinase [Thermomonas carbonis]QNN70430.1 HAMP domain-containing histidine kinase [Thermomonas carbonis]GHB99941.1 two-component sensor histidine kinase [Thermomonas carbonis]
MPEAAAPRRAPAGRRRLRTRIILSFALLGLSLTLLLAFATNWVRGRVEEDMITDLMDRNINAYADRYYASGGRDIGLPVQQMYGRVVGKDKFEALKAEYPEWYGLGDGIHPMVGTDEKGMPLAYKLAVRKTPDTWFFLAYDMQESARRTEKFEKALYLVVPLFTLLSLLLGWWSASRVMAPVSELARRLRRSGNSSDPEALTPYFAEDEVGELAKALDDYSERLTEVVQRDREFNADVSHELRTPLAVIRGAVELLLSKPEIDERTRTRLQRIQRAELQCTDLISALLLLSRNERAVGQCDVGKVAQQLLDHHRAQLGGKPIELRLEGETGVLLEAPESALAVALGNLIGNAVKYTQSGAVVVRVFHDAVEVVDSGPGLSAEDAAKLFERGYRGTHAGHSQGGGIGLSIVRRLCALYGWDVRVRPGDDTGVVATLRFG